MPAETPIPELFYRDGGADKRYDAPVVIIGDVTGIDVDLVTITMRGKATRLYVSNLEGVLGSPDLTLGILMDAANHRDRVRIALTRDKITYDNPAQLARYRAKDSAQTSER